MKKNSQILHQFWWSLLFVFITGVAQAAPIPDWAIKARIANMEPDVEHTDAELDALIAARKAEHVSVLELDPGFSEYLSNAAFTARVNLVQRVTTKAHAQGLKTVVYITSLEVNTVNGETVPNSMFKDHPDWIQRGFNNEPAVFYGSQEDWVEPGMESAWLSPDSGYRSYFINRLKELAGSGVDGIWIDVPVYYGISNTSWGGHETGAATRFKQWSIDNGFSTTGYNLPAAINWNSAVFKAWIKWRHENLATFTDDVRQGIQSINPNILLLDEVFPTDNMDATSTGLDESWRKSNEGHLAVWEVDSVSNTKGMKWSSLEDFSNKITMYKWARGIDRENPSWAFSYGNEALDAGLVMGAAVTAGVAPFASKTPDMTVSVGAAFRTRWFGFLGDNDQALLNTPRESNTAIWYSSPSRDYQDFKIGGGYGMYITTPSPNNDPDWWGDNIGDTPLPKPHLGGYRGAAYALSKLHIPYKIVADPGQPAQQLQGVKFLWLPSVAAISDASAETIKQFVRDGGFVFATGAVPGTMDENGNTRAQNVFKDLFNLSTGVTPLPRANINFGNNNKGGVALYRADIKGREFFPFDAGAQLANENLSDLEQLVRTHADDFVIIDAPQQGVHVEVSRPTATKHYLYVLNYSGLKLPLVNNPQTMGIQYHAPKGYKVVSATVKTPDANGDSGSTAVTKTALEWYKMNVKVGQFALIELTLQSTTAAVVDPFPAPNWATTERQEAAQSGFNFILNKMRHSDKPIPLNAGVYTNLLNNGGLTDIYAHGHHVSAEHMGLTLRTAACMGNQSAWEESRKYIDEVMSDPLYNVVNWAIDRDRQQPLVSFDDQWLNANAPLDDFRVIRGLLDGERAFGLSTQGVPEAKKLAAKLLTGMYRTTVTDRSYSPTKLFPSYQNGIVAYAWDWSGTTDNTLTPAAVATAIGKLSIDPIPVDYNDLYTIAEAAKLDPRWNASLQESVKLLLDSEVPAVPGLFFNGLKANGEWTGDFENRDINQGKHLKVIQVLWIALHLANVSNVSDDLLASAKRQQALEAAQRTLAFFKSYYQANQKIPEYLTFAGGNVPVCTAANVPNGCLVPSDENLLNGEARIYAQAARLALLLNDKPFAAQLISEKILTDRISNANDPRYGQIGVSTASANDAEAWNVLESTLTLCLEAQANGGAVNHPPVANNQSVAVSKDTAKAITLSATDVDPATTLSYVITSQPSHGSLSGTAPNLTYQPTAGYTGSDSFQFTANDGQATSNTATVSLTVTASGTGNPNSNANITIDGNLSDWAGLQSFGDDPDDVTGANNKLDWNKAWMADNAATDSLYIAYQTKGDIQTASFWAYQVYLDTDENAATGFQTGALGADYMLEGATLYHYTGNGTSWSWELVGTATVQTSGNKAEFRLSRSWLGNTSSIRMFFYGNNAAFGGDTVDVYPDDALTAGAGQRYFTYQLGTSVPSNPSNPVASLTLDGSLSDWNGLQSFGTDPDDISGANNKINWLEGWFAHSATDVYLAYKTKDPIDTNGFWGYQMFFDTDENTASGYQTGGMGAEYLFEGTTLYQYTGSGTNWSWTAKGTAAVHVAGNIAEMRLPRSLIGNSAKLRVYYIGNNAPFGGNATDVYPDGAFDANASVRYFTYEFGVAPPATPSNLVSTITMDGSLAEWTALQSFANDPDDVTGANNKINWLQGWLAHSTSKLYFAYKTKDPVDNSGFWGYQIYLDTDSNGNTGFQHTALGAEYLLEGSTLWKYTGNGTSWAWTVVETATVQISGNTAELSISLSSLANNPSSIRLFYAGNNAAFGGNSTDMYPDGALSTSAEVRFFDYNITF